MKKGIAIFFLLLPLFCFELKADTIPPIVVLTGADTAWHYTPDEYIDPGVVVSDNISSEAYLKAHIQVSSDVVNGKTGTYTITYSVTDSAGNGPVSVSRVVVIKDITPPKIEFDDIPIINVCRWSDLEIYQYELNDDFSEQNNIHIDTTGSFLDNRTDYPGLYSYRFEATDEAGNRGYSSWVYINVLSENDPQCEGCGGDWPSDTTVSIKEGIFEKMGVYPNPVADALYISFPEEYVISGSFSVTDIYGKVIHQEAVSPNTQVLKIDLSDVPNGLYFLRIGNLPGYKKIMVRH